MALPRKKKPDDFALLLEAEPADEAEGALGDDLEGEDDELLEEEDAFGDPLEDSDPLAGDDQLVPTIDPEQAALCETLGFSEPDQQQALIDLIKLVNSPDPMATEDSGSDFPALPESTY